MKLTMLQKVNRGFLLLSGILFIHCFVNLLWPGRGTDAAPLAPGVFSKNDRSLGIQNISLSDLTRRNLFRPLIAPPPPAPKVVIAAPPPPPKIPLSQRMAHWRLVGIMADEAVLEDSNSQKTQTLSAGQTLEDDVKVSTISNGRVTLSSGEDRLDLSL